MLTINHRHRLARAMTYEPVVSHQISRKRLLSENNIDSVSPLEGNDATKKMQRFTAVSSIHESSDDNNIHRRQYSSRDAKETRAHSSLPDAMLLCQQQAILDEIDDRDDKKKETSSIFLPSSEFFTRLQSSSDKENARLLIIDCGSPFRFNERRIAHSFLLNINDRLSRKRLVSRGLGNFLDASQLQRFQQSEAILLYDDFIRPATCSASNQMSAAMQCLFDQIQRYERSKVIYVLQSSFDEFFHQYPEHCQVIASERATTSNGSLSPSPTIDLESCLMSEVIPGLFLGNAHDARDRSALDANRIRAIVNISSNIPCHFIDEDEGGEPWEYLQLHCEDSHREDLLVHFDKTFEFIHQRLTTGRNNVLVHCQAGISRSPTIVIGYLMKFHQMSFEQAYALVKSKRSIVNPNWNFLNQLSRYEKI